MLRTIDPSRADTAARIAEIQRAAYAVEARLIGFDGIPQLTETEEQIRLLDDMHWIGAFADEHLVGLIAWEREDQDISIDRLAVDPAYARRGFGRRLVQSVPATKTITVSTGAANAPAVNLYLSEGFEQVGRMQIAPNVDLAEFQRTG